MKYLCIYALIFFGGCTFKTSTSGASKKIDNLNMVILSLVSPASSSSTSSNLTIDAIGEINTTISLYSDNQCSQLLQTASSTNGSVTFNLSLTQFGIHTFYAKQISGTEFSQCNPNSLSYTFLPPEITSITLISPSSPGSSATPQLQIGAVEIGALVQIYADNGCLTPIASGDESGNLVDLTLNLTSPNIYSFYATQKVRGATSNCSPALVSYEYKTTCSGADLTNTPFARGAGASADPFIICTETQFNSISSTPAYQNSEFIIADNIDLTGLNQTNYNIIGGINCSASRFSGVIDGSNHTISNLNYVNATQDNVGILGCFNGTLKNINFSNITLTGRDNVGIISNAGINDSLATVATVNNVKNISGSVTGRDNVGAIVGYGVNANITNNFSNIAVLSTRNFVGGIIGFADLLSTISNNESRSSVSGTVAGTNSFGGIIGKTSKSFINKNTSSGNISGRHRTGGIAGLVVDCLEFDENVSTVTIVSNTSDYHGGITGYATSCTFKKNQFNGTVAGRKGVGGGFGQTNSSVIIATKISGTVTGTSDFLGGLIGYSDNSTLSKNNSSVTVAGNVYASGGLVGLFESSILSNSYFNGSITSNQTSSGGLIGVLNNGTIQYSYSSGTALGSAKGFIGMDAGTTKTLVNNYYASSAAAAPSVLLGSNEIEAKTDAELKSQNTFMNWNFSITWKIESNNFPILQNDRLPSTFYISAIGNDSNPGTLAQPWKSLSVVGNEAIPGDTIIVRGGVYDERLIITVSGNSTDGPIIFKNFLGETPVIDGSLTNSPATGPYGLIEGSNISNIEVEGFELKNATTNDTNIDPMGVYFHGRGENIVIKNLSIHSIENSTATGSAHGILFKGSDVISMKNIKVEGNSIHDLILAFSESLTLNGNIDGFLVKNNNIYNNNNIAIDIGGFYSACPSCIPTNDRARNGIVGFNTIKNITSVTNPAYNNIAAAVGIYVDGGSDVIIENNKIEESDFGIELSSENVGATYYADNVIVRNNLIINNKLAGLALGGYTASRKGCQNCQIVNNTFYNNDTNAGGFGEVYIQHNNLNVALKNNIFYTGLNGLFFQMYGAGSVGLAADFNYYFSLANAFSWKWNSITYSNLSSFKTATGFENSGMFNDPLFVNPSLLNFSLLNTSPAINKGTNLPSSTRGLSDYLNNPRLSGTGIDIGALEF